MQRVSINTIAAEVGVSRNTVSLALRGDPRVVPATRDRVVAAAQKLNYRPNLLARAMVTGRSCVIGLAIPRLNFSYMPRLVDAIQETAFQNNYGVLTCSHYNDVDRLPGLLGYLQDHQVDGIIVQCPVTATGRAAVIESKVPIVTLSFGQKGLPGLSLELLPDAAGDMAVRKLAEAGHRRIGYAGEQTGFFGAARLKGLRNAAAELGLDPPKVFEGEDSLEGGHQAANRFLELRQRPTAIVAFADSVAVGFINKVRSAGVKVPEDLSIVGVDDLPIAEACTPALTTLRAPASEIGSVAVTSLLAGEGSTKSLRSFQWQWLERSTISAVRKSNRSRPQIS